MLNMVNSNLFYNNLPSNDTNKSYSQSWNYSNMQFEMIPIQDIKQESYYSYSESSDSTSYESNPSPANLNANYYTQTNNSQVNNYMEDDQDQEPFSDSTIDSGDDSFKTRVDQKPIKTQNRGGRKQVKIGTTKRNARERNRVRYINNCFEILREHIPYELVDEQKNRKLSKVDTLKYATIYIKQLTELLKEIDGEETMSSIDDYNNLNTYNHAYSSTEKHIMYNNQFSLNNKIANNQMSTIQFNNININIYDNKLNSNEQHVLSSPALSTSSSSSSTSNNNSFYSLSTIKTNAPVYFNCGKALTPFLSANSYHSHHQHAANSNADLKWS